MKILIANIGSTSLKWRLFDFANGAERLLHKGGFERVSDYPQAIEDCLAELKNGRTQSRAKTNWRPSALKPCWQKTSMAACGWTKRVLQAMADYNGLAPAHNPPYITGIRLFAQRMPDVPLVALFETAFYQFAPEPIDALRGAASLA